jgi:UDP-glucose 4-epimerase
MRVLVTGGAGFIGSHIVDHHVAAGDDVVVVDDLSTGSRANIAHHGRAVSLFEGRVEDPAVLDPAFEGVDLVYHLAAAVGVFRILERPLEALRSNIDASEAVFERASRAGVRTIFTSTSEVYGKNGAVALSETDDSIFGPTALGRWLYAVSKAADEFMAFAYAREYGLPVTIVRLFNVTGPRQTGAYGMVLPRFVRQALEGADITVFGDGSQTRCLTNVLDVVHTLRALAGTREAEGQVVNVGNPREISIGDLADLVKRTVGSSSTIRLIPYDEAYGPGFEDMQRRIPDVTRLRELIGSAPSTPLEVTVAQVVAAERAKLADVVSSARSGLGER